MPATTTFHFERYLFDGPTASQVLHELADKATEIETGTGVFTQIYVQTDSDGAHGIIEIRLESEAEADVVMEHRPPEA